MQLSVQHLTKSIGGNEILNDLHLEIGDRDRAALIGRNGSGKTTLFRLLAGLEEPDAGRIVKSKQAEVGYLQQIPRYPGLSVREVLNASFQALNAMERQMQELEPRLADDDGKALARYGELQERFLEAGGYETASKLMAVANGLGLSPLLAQPFERLSGGEKTKVMLAQLILQEPSVLLLDEPTNHLDLSAIDWLEHYLEHYKGAVVVISHDRRFLNRIVRKVYELEDGAIWESKGDYDAYLANKQAKLEQQFAAYKEQQKKIQKIKESIRRLRQWANEASPPNPDLFRKAKMMEKMLERMELIKRPPADKAMKLKLEANDRSGKMVFELCDVFHGFGDEVLFADVDLSVYWQDRLAIVGDNGAGKSTLLRILLGEIEPAGGTVRRGSNVKIGYLAQQFDQFDEDARVIEAFRDNLALAEGDARHVLAQFLFYGHDIFKRVRDLSGGEKMRLRLAQLMQQQCNVLVLDEPTNHLDIESREVLEDVLGGFGGTILAISHDRYFLEKLFTKTAWLEAQTLTLHEGSFDWAADKQQQQRSALQQPS